MAAQVRQGLRSARDAFDRDGGASAEQSAWAAFKAEYGPEVSERFPDISAENIKLRFGEMPDDVDMIEVLKEGLRAWIRSGRDAKAYRCGRMEWSQDGRRHVKKGKRLDDHLPKTVPVSDLKSVG